MMVCRCTFEDKVRWGMLTAQWQQGTLDFIQLMHIDYRTSFQCEHGSEFLTADGISLGYHISQAYMARPWASDPDSAPVWGSNPADRLLIRDPSQRKLLLEYAKTGLSEPQLDVLKAGILHSSGKTGISTGWQLQLNPGIYNPS